MGEGWEKVRFETKLKASSTIMLWIQTLASVCSALLSFFIKLYNVVEMVVYYASSSDETSCKTVDKVCVQEVATENRGIEHTFYMVCLTPEGIGSPNCKFVPPVNLSEPSMYLFVS